MSVSDYSDRFTQRYATAWPEVQSQCGSVTNMHQWIIDKKQRASLPKDIGDNTLHEHIARVIAMPEHADVRVKEFDVPARVIPVRLPDEVLYAIGSSLHSDEAVARAHRYEYFESEEATGTVLAIIQMIEPYQDIPEIQEVVMFAAHYVRHATVSGIEPAEILENVRALINATVEANGAVRFVAVPDSDVLKKSAENPQSTVRKAT